MKSLKQFFFGLLLATIVTQSSVTAAQAADAESPDLSADPGYNWEGFYIGAGLGGGAAGVDILGVGAKDKLDIKDKGMGVFGLAGYNYMAGDWLIGVEGSLSSVGLDDSKALTGLGKVRAQSDWLGTMQLRGGYAFDSLLVYGTVGLALTDIELSSSLGGKFDKTVAGSVVGVGLEYGFADNWSMRAEALAMGFRDEATLAGGKRKFDTGDAIVRVGISHTF